VSVSSFSQVQTSPRWVVKMTTMTYPTTIQYAGRMRTARRQRYARTRTRRPSARSRLTTHGR